MTEDFGPPESAIDIGGGCMIVYAEYQGEHAGINHFHRKPDGAWCCGWVSFNDSAWGKEFNNQGWNVVQKEPLTLTPSLLCRSCGHHGFITNGKWVPA